MIRFSVDFELCPREICVELGTLSVVHDGSGVEPYEGDYVITPAVAAQTMATSGKRLTDNVTVEAIPYHAVSNEQNGLTVNIGG